MLIWSTIALCVFASFCLAPWVEAEVELGCRRSIFADEERLLQKFGSSPRTGWSTCCT